MGGCQNYGPSLDPYSNTAPSILGIQKGTIVLITTHVLRQMFMGSYLRTRAVDVAKVDQF